MLPVTSSTVPARQGRRSRRQPTALWRVPVSRVERIAPRMVRVTAGGPQLDSFVGSGTDQHVKLYFYPEGTELPEPLTVATARVSMSRLRPWMRSYTIRRHDRQQCEIDIDFVLHDDPGPASDWAGRARPGDELIFVGPSPAYQPAPEAHTYLLAGDSSALPAIEAILRELPAGTRAQAFLQLTDPAERRALPSPATVEVTWLDDGVATLLGALRETELPSTGVDTWVAAERSIVQAVRGFLLTELRLDRRHVRTTAYWRRGRAEGTSSGENTFT